MTIAKPAVTADDIVYNTLVKRAGETLWAESGITCRHCHQPFRTNQVVSVRTDMLLGDSPLDQYIHTACVEGYNTALVDQEFEALTLPHRPPTTQAKVRVRAMMFAAMLDICQARRVLTGNPSMSPAGVQLWRTKLLEGQVLLAALGNVMEDLKEWNHDE